MGIALNEDNSHFYFTRPGQPVTLGTVDALVDQYAGTQVSRLPVEALRDGYNVIEVHAQAALTVTWVEIALDPAARALTAGCRR